MIGDVGQYLPPHVWSRARFNAALHLGTARPLVDPFPIGQHRTIVRTSIAITADRKTPSQPNGVLFQWRHVNRCFWPINAWALKLG